MRNDKDSFFLETCNERSSYFLMMLIWEFANLTRARSLLSSFLHIVANLLWCSLYCSLQWLAVVRIRCHVPFWKLIFMSTRKLAKWKTATSYSMISIFLNFSSFIILTFSPSRRLISVILVKWIINEYPWYGNWKQLENF